MYLSRELRPMLRLTVPVVLSDLGWMAMGIVDTMMVGRITPGTATAIGAVSIGSIFFYTVAMFGGGLMLGLDTLVSHAYGAGRRDECYRSLLSGLYLIVPLAPALMCIVWSGVPLFRVFRYEPALLAEIARFMRALVWSLPPLLVYFALRRYLQATSRAGPVVFALVTANLVNLIGNWILIYGHLGAPALGTAGSALSTVAARIYMAAILAGYVLFQDWPWHISLGLDLVRIRELLRLGLPVASQITLEVGVFATAGALIGKLGEVPLAAHQIAIQTISATYMVPLGISTAAAVRVGQALGRGDPHAASRAGWTAVMLGAAFMSGCGVALVAMPRAIGRVFTTDAAVVEAAVALLAVAAAFQLFDGLQTCAMGALRGAGDTRTAMLCHLVAYWTVGLPVGYVLCFRFGLGAVGMWVGLGAAVILIGIALLWVWWRKTNSICAGASEAVNVGTGS
jgi:multidrug resistance protein, MATE family